MVVHVLILLNLHRCQTCSYACRTTSQLVVHLRKHTGDAPFSCLYCDSKFKIKSDMKRHMRTHTGEKPFKCEQCDFSCSAKSKYTFALSSAKQIFKYVINIWLFIIAFNRTYYCLFVENLSTAVFGVLILTYSIYFLLQVI